MCQRLEPTGCQDYQEDHVGLHPLGERPYCLFWRKAICVLGWNCRWEGRPSMGLIIPSASPNDTPSMKTTHA